MNTALITGASSGIGKELAKIFAKNNYNLILVARRRERLEELKQELEKDNVKVSLIITDLSKKNAPEKIKKTLEDNKITVTTLINNAGFGHYGEFKDTKLDKMEDMIEVNITALTKLTHLFIQEIIKAKGEILNVASVAAFFPGPLMSVYYATKAYVLSFSEAIAEELHDKGVTVSVLCPGPVETEFQKVADIKTDMGKIPTAKEVAKYGYEMLKKGKRVAIHGTNYKALTKITKFIPRKTIAGIMKNVSKKEMGGE